MKEAIDMALYGVAEPIQFWVMEPPLAPGGFPKIRQIREKEEKEELEKTLYGIDYMKQMEEDIIDLIEAPRSEPEGPPS